jgi:hypothetical protein
MLKTSSADATRHAATALTHALQNPASAKPFAPIGDNQMRVINQLAKLFATATNLNEPPAAPRNTRLLPNPPGLRKHTTRNVSFSLVVDTFGVKYVRKDNAQHLVDALATLYEVATNWAGKLYCGLTIQWDYPERHVDIYMPGYIEAALHKFQHPSPTRAKDAPHDWTKPTYCTTVQYAPANDSTVSIPAPEITRSKKSSAPSYISQSPLIRLCWSS